MNNIYTSALTLIINKNCWFLYIYFLNKLYSTRESLELLKGDIVNIILTDSTDDKFSISVDSNHNLLVAHPDLLLSGTTISNGIACKRRAVLSELFKVSFILKSFI